MFVNYSEVLIARRLKQFLLNKVVCLQLSVVFNRDVTEQTCGMIFVSKHVLIYLSRIV